jgi:protein-S-isoprenylcysteine O-methyltransferase Ste14
VGLLSRREIHRYYIFRLMRTIEKLTRKGKKATFAPFRWLAIQAISFYLAAGTFALPKATLYFGLGFITSTASAWIMWKMMPKLANRRGDIKPGTKSWDIVLVVSFLVTSIIVIPIVCGLDVGRFKWSSPGFGYTAVGIVLYMAAYSLLLWAMVVNTYFEATVRIQHDRGHKVISTGPYTMIRHPGYLAMIVFAFAIPMVIGSIVGLLPALLSAKLIVLRTFLEDRTLQKELNGYPEYAAKVRYRLVWGLW